MTAIANKRLDIFFIFFIVLIGLETTGWSYYVVTNSYFIDNDIEHFSRANHSTFIDFILSPIDIHFVPLHRLFNYFIHRYFPMNFQVAVAILISCHVISLFYLYKLMRLLSAGPHNILLLFLYAGNAYLIVPLMWWSAGIHRFPYIMLSIMSIYYFVLFTNTNKIKNLIFSTSFYVIALGFYSKAVLIPVYLLAILFTQIQHIPKKNLKQLYSIVIALILTSLVYTFFYLSSNQSAGPKIATNIPIIFETWTLGLSVIAQVLLSTTFSNENLLLINILWFIAMIVTIKQHPSTLKYWILGIGLVALNVFMIAISQRVIHFGTYTSLIMRYHYEVIFIAIIFLNSIIGSYYKNNTTTPPPTYTLKHTIVIGISIFLYMYISYESATKLATDLGDRHQKAAVYGNNIESLILRHPTPKSLYLIDTLIPSYISGSIFPFPTPMSEFLSMHNFDGPHFNIPNSNLSEVASDGTLVKIQKKNLIKYTSISDTELMNLSPNISVFPKNCLEFIADTRSTIELNIIKATEKIILEFHYSIRNNIDITIYKNDQPNNPLSSISLHSNDSASLTLLKLPNVNTSTEKNSIILDIPTNAESLCISHIEIYSY